MSDKYYRITQIRKASNNLLFLYKELFREAHPLGPQVADMVFDNLPQVKRLREALEGKPEYST
jgi:hypothetical protein